MKTLADSVKKYYTLSLDTVEARVAMLKTGIKKHLEKSTCYHFYELPEKGKPDETKYARGAIVSAIIGALKPDDFQESIRLEVQNSNLKYDHIAVLKTIVDEGNQWERVHRKKRAVKKARSPTTNGSQSNSGYNGGNRDGNSRSGYNASVVNGNRANVNSGRVFTYDNAKCISCDQQGHWFLKRDKSGEYVQNCPKACDDFEKFKKISLDAIAESKLKKKQRYANQRALLADHTNSNMNMQKAMETVTAGQQELATAVTALVQAIQGQQQVPKASTVQVSEGILRQTNDERLKLLTKQ